MIFLSKKNIAVLERKENVRNFDILIENITLPKLYVQKINVSYSFAYTYKKHIVRKTKKLKKKEFNEDIY